MRLTRVLGASHIWQGVLFAIGRTIILKLCDKSAQDGLLHCALCRPSLFCPYFWPTFTKSAVSYCAVGSLSELLTCDFMCLPASLLPRWLVCALSWELGPILLIHVC